MALNDLWRKLIKDEDTDDGATYYRPRKKNTAPSLVDEPDDDAFRAPKTRTGASRVATANDYDDLSDDINDVYEDSASVSKPRFKRVMATDLKAAEHAIDLVMRKYVVLVNTEGLADAKLVPFRCYIAGAVQALGAHITPLDDESVFVSIEPFDATPYLPAQDETEELEDDFI